MRHSCNPDFFSPYIDISICKLSRLHLIVSGHAWQSHTTIRLSSLDIWFENIGLKMWGKIVVTSILKYEWLIWYPIFNPLQLTLGPRVGEYLSCLLTSGLSEYHPDVLLAMLWWWNWGGCLQRPMWAFWRQFHSLWGSDPPRTHYIGPYLHLFLSYLSTCRPALVTYCMASCLIVICSSSLTLPLCCFLLCRWSLLSFLGLVYMKQGP